MELMKEFRFEAAHVLPRHPGKCSRLHGHSWKLYVFVSGSVDEKTGFVKDYALIKEAVQPLIDDLDHRFLGCCSTEHVGDYQGTLADVFPAKWCVGWLEASFYPSSENLLVRIGERLVHALDWSALRLDETCTSAAMLGRREFDELQRRKADAAGAPVAPPTAN